MCHLVEVSDALPVRPLRVRVDVHLYYTGLSAMKKQQ